jgi:hypothetical protein
MCGAALRELCCALRFLSFYAFCGANMSACVTEHKTSSAQLGVGVDPHDVLQPDEKKERRKKAWQNERKK